MKYIEKKSASKIPEIDGSIVDTTNINDKITNTYSARVIDELVQNNSSGGSGIEEIITNNNGTSIKYTDGRLECFHYLNLGTGLAVTRAYGGIYITPTTYSWTFPTPFIEIPQNIQVTGMLPGGVGGAVLSNAATTTNIPTIYIWHAQSYTFSSKESGIYLSARGRWK